VKRRAAVVAASVVLIFASRSFAQSPPPANEPSSDNRALAETLFFAGKGLMEAKRYHDACIKLAESYRLDPAAGTLLNLAVCHEAEGKTASAWGEFRQALADARRMNRPDREQLAQDRIKALEPDLPFLTITVPADVRKLPGLSVKRNGVAMNAPTWDTELPVDPGTVEIVTTATGYKPRTQTIDLQKQEHKSIAVQALELAPIDPNTIPFWTPRRRVGALFLGVGVVGVGVGAWQGLSAISDKKDSDNQCPTIDGERRCTQAGADAMSKARTASWISDIGFGVGAAALVVGSYFFFTPGGAEQRPQPQVGNINVRFVAGPTGAQGLLTGSF
jgi:hypothetical protein